MPNPVPQVRKLLRKQRLERRQEPRLRLTSRHGAEGDDISCINVVDEYGLLGVALGDHSGCALTIQVEGGLSAGALGGCCAAATQAVPGAGCLASPPAATAAATTATTAQCAATAAMATNGANSFLREQSAATQSITQSKRCPARTFWQQHCQVHHCANAEASF